MARQRAADRAHLPDNLHVLKRPKGDYFTYHSPLSKRSIALGYDRDSAIEYANEANKQVEEDRWRRKEHARSIKHASFDEKGLIDGNGIVRKSVRYDHVCGVYFLIRDQTIVYVGQSANVLLRLSDHRRAPEKIFDSFYFIECKAAELDRLEALYIEKFQPVYNASKPYVAPHATAWSGTLSDLLSV